MEATSSSKAMEKNKEVQIRKIVARANQIRRENPEVFGEKGACRGHRNYVPNGWNDAIRNATIELKEEGQIPESSRRKKPRLVHSITDEKQKEMYGNYLLDLRRLKKKYVTTYPEELEGVMIVKSERPKKGAPKRPTGRFL